MARVDLDAARAARREAAGEAPVVVFGGTDYSLPVELPFEVAEALAGLSEVSSAEAAKVMESIFRILLGDGYETFVAEGPSLNDMNALMEAIGELYGVKDTGESKEPGASS